MRETFYTSETELVNTGCDTTPRVSRTTTEETPFVFESSLDYEGLDNNRDTDGGDRQEDNLLTGGVASGETDTSDMEMNAAAAAADGEAD